MTTSELYDWRNESEL